MPGLNVPDFFADFGTISTAKHWGGTPRFDSTGGNIFIDHVAQTVDKALAIDVMSVDHPSMDGPTAMRLYRALCDKFQTESLWLRTPDMQGPLNTAGLVLNQEELLIGMYTEPEKVHALLAKVTDLLFSYMRFFMQQSGNRVLRIHLAVHLLSVRLGHCLYRRYHAAAASRDVRQNRIARPEGKPSARPARHHTAVPFRT